MSRKPDTFVQTSADQGFLTLLQVSGREVFEFHPELVDDDDDEADDTRYANEESSEEEEEVSGRTP